MRPGAPLPPVMTMITHGRRSLGESWRKIVIRPTPEGSYEIENEPTEAPADNTAIFVPGMGNISTEMADFVLERSRDRSRDRAKVSRQSQAEITKEINAAWHDYCEQKLAWFQGKTTVGAGGMHQRERMPDRHGR